LAEEYFLFDWFIYEIFILFLGAKSGIGEMMAGDGYADFGEAEHGDDFFKDIEQYEITSL
jgi:hypothetical protein